MGFNVSKLAYMSVSGTLDVVIRNLCKEERKALKQSGVGYCIRFCCRDGAFHRVLDIVYALLSHPKLIESVQFSDAIVCELRKVTNGLLDLYVGLHNYFIIHGKESHSFLQNILYNVDKSVDCDVSQMKLLCDSLLSSSNFMGEYFIVFAICVKYIEFYSDTIKCLFSDNAVSKTKRMSCNKSLSASTGIDGCNFVSMNYAIYKQDIDADFYFEKLRTCCSEAVQNYHFFLLEGLETKYGCSFEQLLVDLASASLMNPGKNLFPDNEVFICSGKVKVFSALKRKSISETTKDSSIPYKKVCYHGDNGSISSSATQKSSSQFISSAGGSGSETSQKDNCTTGPSSDVTKRSYNQSIFPVKRPDPENQKSGYYIASPSSTVTGRSYNQSIFSVEKSGSGSQKNGYYIAGPSSDVTKQSYNQAIFAVKKTDPKISRKNGCYIAGPSSAVTQQSHSQSIFPVVKNNIEIDQGDNACRRI
ncbi:hypothetical protein K6025_05060 [Ehrlichia sp. JZT12]